eukprot:TRINITY_DN8540_c0_g1_i1.p1 TRINITY_DN8540_c0_g1~~TRINITY_DN8540_c0_g1_i1.p1  ORF type:complete len:262 (-),score=80.06 TRINITY_DN8540_c0_g1_i1:14-799(-)
MNPPFKPVYTPKKKTAATPTTSPLSSAPSSKKAPTNKKMVTTVSKYLAYILRHGAEKMNLHMSSDGYIKVMDILSHPESVSNGYTLEQVKEAVACNDKQRYSLKDDEGILYIKANQGHSIKVDDLELKKISKEEVPPNVIHGTYRKYWKSIEETGGLSKMKRNHIHLATGEYKDSGVISGMRGTCDLLVYIDTLSAILDGIEFYLSPNGVVLTEGVNGILPIKYFAQVLNSRDRSPFISSSSSSSTSSSSPTSTSTSTSTP